MTGAPVRVLYANHTATVSGSEHSLLTLLAGLGERAEASVACPPGPLAERVAALGIPVVPITATAGSLRLHPLHTPRALAEMTLAGREIGRAARAWRADVVHANSIRTALELAAAPVGGAARIAQVRDVLPAGAVTHATLRAIAARSAVIVANSHYTANGVRASAPSARIEVVHPAIDGARFDPARVDPTAARAELSLPAARAVLGVVAQITPWKGQDTAIEALGLLAREGVDAQLVLVGSAKFTAGATRFDNVAFERRLHELAAELGVAERVSWLGERSDVAELVRSFDVLLLPSHEEPFGRALLEAMALEVPVVATSVGGPTELVRDGVDGYLAAPREPAAWASAARAIVEDRALAAAMGRAGRDRVLAEFGVAQHVDRTLAVYAEALRR